MIKLSNIFFSKAEKIITSRDDEVRVCCPACGDVKFHLYYNTTKGLYHCFRCGISGRTVGKVVSSQLCSYRYTSEVEIPILKDSWSDDAISYLSRRNLLIATSYAKEGAGKWKGYIVFSLYPEGWIGRAFSSGIRPCYKFAKGTSVAVWFDPLLLMNTKSQKVVYLVEGVFDALRLIQCGVVPIALCGCQVSKRKLTLIDYLGKKFNISKLVILLDADAKSFARELELKLVVLSYSTQVTYLPTGDPADFSVDKIKFYLKL